MSEAHTPPTRLCRATSPPRGGLGFCDTLKVTALIIISLKENAQGRKLRYTSGPNCRDLQQRRRCKTRTAYHSICYFTF